MLFGQQHAHVECAASQQFQFSCHKKSHAALGHKVARTFLIPATQVGAVVESLDSILMATQDSVGVAKVIMPSRLCGVLCYVPDKDVDVTLSLVSAATQHLFSGLLPLQST